MTASAYLHGLSTVVPPYELPQDMVEVRARRILGPKFKAFERMAKTFTTSGVERRYSVAPIDWFETPADWPDRNTRYIDGATDMFVDAATQALDEASWSADEVDIIVTVSSTGIATPTLEAQAKDRMGFRDDVLRVPVFGLGCAGGVSGLSIARELAVARPGAKVLLVVVESCTLSFRSDKLTKADIISTVLFGDGGAAVCLSTEKTRVELGRGITKTWPDTLPIMGWSVEEDGLGVIFDRSIPDFTTQELRSAVDDALPMMGLTLNKMDRLVSHPGGAKVVEAIESALELGEGSLDAERDVLRDYGNMSAPTVLFVLKAVLERGQTGRLLTLALGPGFSAAFLPVTVAA